MTLSSKDDAMNAKKALANCRDFLTEKSAIQEAIEERGHILRLSPKYHPEIAGVGIEYSWGKAKQEFRNRINDCEPKNLAANTRAALSM